MSNQGQQHVDVCCSRERSEAGQPLNGRQLCTQPREASSNAPRAERCVHGLLMDAGRPGMCTRRQVFGRHSRRAAGKLCAVQQSCEPAPVARLRRLVCDRSAGAVRRQELPLLTPGHLARARGRTSRALQPACRHGKHESTSHGSYCCCSMARAIAAAAAVVSGGIRCTLVQTFARCCSQPADRRRHSCDQP